MKTIPKVDDGEDSLKKKSTSQHLKRVAPCLYRHDENSIYHGIKRYRGKLKSRSLDTTDRKTADRKLKTWVDSLENPEVEKLECPTLAETFEKFVLTKSANEPATKRLYEFTRKLIEKHANHLLSRPLTKIKPSDLSIVLAPFQKKYVSGSFNKFSDILRQVFAVAYMDGDIQENPFARMPKEIRHMVAEQDKPKDTVPTIEECEQIEECVRSGMFSHKAEHAADYISFLHRSGLGEAEAKRLTFEHIDLESTKFPNGLIKIIRKKTGMYFEIPIYNHILPLIKKLIKDAGGNPPKTNKVFEIYGIKYTLYTTCEHLNLPRFSPKDLRKARITWMLRKYIPVEIIAAWQGHRDNGILIRKTYSHVIDSGMDEYRRQQLAKLSD